MITACPNCSNFEPIRTKINVTITSLSQNLSCGQTYVFTVTAVTKLEVSTARQTSLQLEPAAIEPVTNLTVKYIPGNFSDESWDRFQVTWDPPKNLSPRRIQVQRSLDKNSHYSCARAILGYIGLRLVAVQKRQRANIPQYGSSKLC